MTGEATFKKIAFLAPRPGMDLETFAAYWRGTHGPTVANAPGYARFRSRYAQNHNIGDGPVGASFPYPGIAIFHLPGHSEEAAFARSATYQDHVRVDELNFIDMDRTLSMSARECVVRAGDGPAKLIVLAGYRDGLDRAEADRRSTDIAARALGSAGDFTDALAGWTLNHVVAGSFQLPGARTATGLRIDCIHELWFHSEEDMSRAFASAAYRDRIAPALDGICARDHRWSFRAEEIVFFAAGQPTARAVPAPPVPPPGPAGQNRT